MSNCYPCDFKKACHVHWAVLVMGWTQTKAAIEIGLNVGTVSHIVHGRRFFGAFPIPLNDNTAP
jgi:hypothetical protein